MTKSGYTGYEEEAGGEAEEVAAGMVAKLRLDAAKEAEYAALNDAASSSLSPPQTSSRS